MGRETVCTVQFQLGEATLLFASSQWEVTSESENEQLVLYQAV